MGWNNQLGTKRRTGNVRQKIKESTDRQYQPTKNGGRGLIGLEEYMRAKERGLACQIETSTEQ